MKYRYTAEEKAILWLDSFGELTYRQKMRLLSVPGTAVELAARFAENEEGLSKIVPESTYGAMRRTLKDENYLPSLLSNLERKGIFFVTFRSADYPEFLAQTPAPPVVLYCKGNRELLKGEHFSVVGSRRTLPWAQTMAKEFSSRISERFTVVTGLAEGGDAAVLQGALEGKGERANIVSVLAYGMDFVYPAVHADLLNEVCRRGLVVTEHRPEVKPQKYLFPVRNRIIAGFGRGVLVISGGKRSGTGITANYALEYGRDVFAFPYNPGIASGEGCNDLLKNGAYLADCVEDVLEYYGVKESEKNVPVLNAEEERLVRALFENGETHVEELARFCGVPVYLVVGLLTGLEAKGCVVRAGGNRYAAVKRIR